MAAGEELERLVVKLVGDGLQYRKMQEQAQRETKETASTVKRAATKMTASMLGFVRKTRAGLQSLQASLQDTSSRMKLLGTGLTLGITLPVAGAAVGLVKLASDAEETQAKFDTVFSRVAKSATDMANVLDESYGMAAGQSRRLLSDTADILTGFGLTQEAALDMSGEVQKLAADLASFQNLQGGAERASRALTKALLGERESAKELGITILGADVKARVALNTTKGLTFATERQAMAYATLQLAQEQSKNAIGDIARTQWSFANQLRELKADLVDTAVAFGRDLLPYAQKALAWVRSLVSWFKQASPAVRKAILVVSGLAAALGPLLIAMGTFVGALAAAVGFIATFGVVALKIVAVVAAITAGVTALGAAVLSVAHWLGVDFVQAWGTAKEAAQDFAQKAMGFFANFGDNLRILYQWVRDNWQNLLKDMLALWATWQVNMVHNLTVAIRTMNRLWVAFGGWLANQFVRLWEGDFTKAIGMGLFKALRMLERWRQTAVDIIASALTPWADEVDTKGLVQMLKGDFENGVQQANFFDTARDIIKDEAKNLRFFDGFKSSIVEGPKLITTIADDAKEANKAIQDIGGEAPTAGGVPEVTEKLKAAKTEAKAFADNTQAAKEELLEIQGTEVGTAEAAAKIADYLALRATTSPTAAPTAPQAVSPAAVTAAVTATPLGSPAARGGLDPATSKHYGVVEALLGRIAANTGGSIAVLEPAGV